MTGGADGPVGDDGEPVGTAVRLGILTGGGDCPGLNAVIRAVVLTGSVVHGDDTVGFLDGWKGVLEDNAVMLSAERCRDIMPVGGTILGTSRTNPFAVRGWSGAGPGHPGGTGGRRPRGHRR